MRPEKVSRKTTNLGRLILLPLALLAATAFAQNPVPFVNQPLVPSAVAPRPEHSFGRPAQGTSAPRRLENYGMLPMAFEPNLGQSHSPARFLARGRGYALFLTGDEMVLSLPSRQLSVFSPQPSATRNWKLETGNSKIAGGNLPGIGDRPGAPGFGSLLPTPDFQLPVPDTSGPKPRPTAPSVVRLQLVGANPHAKVVGLDELPGKSNYFIGNDPKQWRTNVPNFRRLRYQDVYPGIDVEFYGSQGQLEYDFVVHPGADPKAIKLAVGAGLVPARRRPQGSPLRIGANGDLAIATDAGEVRLRKPLVYQPAADDGRRGMNAPISEFRTQNSEFVSASYTLTAENQIAFNVRNYDRGRTLVIDPVLAYSTYLGGSASDGGNAIAVDSSGNAYVTGYTESANFPTTRGALQGTSGGGYDAFVFKLSADGSSLMYSTYLGGSGDDYGEGIAVDSFGSAYVTGYTSSTGFPTTSGAKQTTTAGSRDAFAAKLSADGSSLMYSTYLGGSGDDYGGGIAVDSFGSAYLTGYTESSDFPTTRGAKQTNFGGVEDAFVAKLSADGSSLAYSTYLGGSADDYGRAIAVDSSGGAYVTGYTFSADFPTTSGALQATCNTCGQGSADAFAAKMSADGSSLTYSTYLGGSGTDVGNGIAVDSSGEAYVAGYTFSTNFPTTSGAFQTTNAGPAAAFVSKLSADGTSLVYSTYLGGSGYNEGYAISVDILLNPSVTGYTSAANFPTTNGAVQRTNAGVDVAFVTKLSADGSSLTYSTYLGGSGNDGGQGIAVDSSGNLYVTGYTSSANFPVTTRAEQPSFGGLYDAFVAKFDIASLQPVSLAPLGLIFAEQLVGTTSAAQPIVLNNQSSASVNISSITVSGDFALDPSGSTCSISAAVAAGSNCSLSVTFTPTATGSRTGTLTVTDDAANSPQTAALFGTGVNPAPAISPASLSFGNQDLNTTSPPQTVTLTNSGSVPLAISGINVTGNFAETNTCGTSVPASGNCAINVTFTPTAAGALTGLLRIRDYAVNSPQTVSLTGTGVPPTVTLSATTLTFGSYGIGITSPAQTVTVSNNGPGPLTVTKVTTSGDFAQTNNCVGTVAALASCTINVTFTPTTGGTRAGFVTITDNAAGSPQTVTLSGTGTPPTATASPTSLNFGNVSVGATTTAQAVTLSNSGPGPLAISGISVSGANANDFPQTNNCPSSLAASASCTVNVTFKPSVNSAESATLTLKDNAASNPQTISLSGTGQAPVAGLSPGSLDFPGQTVGVTSAPEAVTLTNSGALALTISGVLVTSPFAQSNNCPASPATLAPGSSCTITLTFTAAFAGTTFGSLYVSDNSLTGAQQPVTLTGEATVSFGNQPVGEKSTAQAVTVANGSTTATVTVTGATATGDFAVASNPCGALPPLASCAPTVTFTPSAPGTRTGALVIKRSSGSALSVPLTGTGLGATATLSKPSIAFGSQLVGTTSAATAITITNNGNQPLNFTTIAASGDFSVAASGTTCAVGTAVAAGANCAISVTFKPTVGGARAGALTLADNASGSPQMVALSGTGEDFSIGPASGSSTTQSVPAGQAATYNLTFSPAGGFTGTATLTCTGAPAGATCTINPASLALSGTTAADATVTVTTTAKTMALPSWRWDSPVVSPRAQRSPWGMPLTWLALLAIVTLVAAVSHRRTPRVAQSLRCSNSAVLDRRPAEKPQSFWKTKLCATSLAVILLLVVIWAACGGGGAAPPPPAPGVSLSGTSLTFSNQNMGTTSTAQTVTLTNSGNAALSITGIALAGANSGDFAQTNTCGSSVSAAANCQIKAAFSPSATGTRTGSVTITDNATGSPQAVSLSGMGVPPATPAGSYALTVTASSSNGVSHSIALTLTVM